MNGNELQNLLVRHSEVVNGGERSALEILGSATEELGEVAQEVLLFEKVGSKRNWKRPGDVASIAGELADLMVNLFCLAHHFDIDLERHLRDRAAGERAA
jgi:NTP pyrophosphatase (non-canonical NTP hydrolase)